MGTVLTYEHLYSGISIVLAIYFGKEEGKYITKQGKNYAGHQRFLCKHCGVVFVSTKGTPLYRRKLSEQKIKNLCKELVEKKGIRAVERTTGIHRDTIGSYLSAFAEHAISISEYLTNDMDMSAYDADEFWSFVKKKQKKLKPNCGEEATSGDFWGYTIVKRKSFFFADFALGKRTDTTCRLLFDNFKKHIKKPTPENNLEIFTDGNFGYERVLPKYFDIDSMDYGQLIKIKEKGRVVDKKKIIVFGNPDISEIETTNVECLNTILRNRLSRLVRQSQCHAKNKYKLNSAVELFKFYWNFMKPLHGKVSPGMEENLTHKLWTWGNFLHTPRTFVN